jgi:hypothetical protein
MRALALALFLSWNLAVLAQSGVKVELDEVVDNRVNAGAWHGSLDFRVKLVGAAADKANAARIVVKEARDDRGTVLFDSTSKSPSDFTPRDYNSGTLQFQVGSPARAAHSIDDEVPDVCDDDGPVDPVHRRYE